MKNLRLLINVSSNAKIQRFKWEMQGEEFEAKVLLMHLKGCELILGIEWLKYVGTVKWDFSSLIMEFMWKEKLVKLEVGQGGKLKVLESEL